MKKAKFRRQTSSKWIVILAIAGALTLAIVGAVCLLGNKTPQKLPQDTTAQTQMTSPTEPTPPQQAQPQQTYPRDEDEDYDRFVGVIEEGDSVAVAQMLLDGEVPQTVISRLAQEDPKLLDYLLTDALAEYAKQGKVEELVRLRHGGYLTDTCMYDYWEVVGARLPEDETLHNAAAGVDALLVHELVLAYHRDDYAIRTFREMRESGLLDDPTHAALVTQLGFDYTNDQFLQDNEIGGLRQLSPEEKATYDTILALADEGDCEGIAMLMIQGEVTELVFEKLLEEDREMVDYIIAQAMGLFSEENAYEYSVMLRISGFVSNDCFQIYWDIMGSDGVDGETFDEEHPGVDRYLLYELTEIYNRDREYGLEALRTIRKSGLMNDLLHEQLMARLGFDYMA